jgi:AcrR family transcriptional regulator
VLPELLSQDEHAFRLRMWEQVVATDAHDTLTRERGRVLSTARRAFARRGFAAVSVSEICDSVGIAKGTFYGIFASKEELFLSAADAAVADVARHVDDAEPSGPLAQRTIAAVLDRLLRAEALLLVELALRGGHGSADDAAAARRLLGTLEAAVARRLREPGSPQAAAALVDAALGRSLRRFAFRPDRVQ